MRPSRRGASSCCSYKNPTQIAKETLPPMSDDDSDDDYEDDRGLLEVMKEAIFSSPRRFSDFVSDSPKTIGDSLTGLWDKSNDMFSEGCQTVSAMSGVIIPQVEESSSDSWIDSDSDEDFLELDDVEDGVTVASGYDPEPEEPPPEPPVDSRGEGAVRAAIAADQSELKELQKQLEATSVELLELPKRERRNSDKAKELKEKVAQLEVVHVAAARRLKSRRSELGNFDAEQDEDTPLDPQAAVYCAQQRTFGRRRANLRRQARRCCDFGSRFLSALGTACDLKGKKTVREAPKEHAAEGEEPPCVLGAVQQHAADRLFEVYDVHGTGRITPKVFSELLVSVADLSVSEVLETIRRVKGSEKRGLDKGALYSWLATVCGGETEVEFVEYVGDMLVLRSPLSVQRRQWADKLFGAYDTDGSGEIDLEELTALMKNSDPEVDDGDVRATLESVGSTTGELDRYHFHCWISLVFGVLDEKAFEDVVDDLMRTAPPPEVPAEAKMRENWVRSVFEAHEDTRQEKAVRTSKFARGLRKRMPQLLSTDLDKSLTRVGADECMRLRHFRAWVQEVLGDLEDESYQSCMQALLQSGHRNVEAPAPLTEHRPWVDVRAEQNSTHGAMRPPTPRARSPHQPSESSWFRGQPSQKIVFGQA